MLDRLPDDAKDTAIFRQQEVARSAARLKAIEAQWAVESQTRLLPQRKYVGGETYMKVKAAKEKAEEILVKRILTGVGFLVAGIIAFFVFRR